MTRFWTATPGDDKVTGATNTENFFDDFGLGADKLSGGRRNDTFVMETDEWTDHVDGGRGNDTVDYSQAYGPLRIDLKNGITVGTVFDDHGWGPVNPHSAFVTTLKNIENVVGTSYDDTILGDGGDNVLTGAGGRDLFIFGEDNGHDIITDFRGAERGFQLGPIQDQILIDDVFEDVADLFAHSLILGDDFVIQIDDHNSITLEGASRYVGSNDFVII